MVPCNRDLRNGGFELNKIGPNSNISDIRFSRKLIPGATSYYRHKLTPSASMHHCSPYILEYCCSICSKLAEPKLYECN